MPRPNQINLDQAAHCHGSNFNVSSSPNQHSNQSDQFWFLNLHVAAQTSNFFKTCAPHTVQHLDKHKMKRSKPTHLARRDQPLDPRSVAAQSQLSKSTAASTIHYCVEVWHRREWSRITGGHSTGSPSPTTIFAMSILRSYFVFCSLCHIS
jgi:hypothetical protein